MLHLELINKHLSHILCTYFVADQDLQCVHLNSLSRPHVAPHQKLMSKMAPKKHQHDNKRQTKLAIKKEPGQEQGVCVNGLAGKALTNKINYKLKTGPAWLRKVYDSQFKTVKTSMSGAKLEFVTEMLSDDSGDYNSQYFQRIKSTAVSQSVDTGYKWLSYAALAQQEDPALIPIMVRQGKLETRPHAGLNHEDEALKELAPHLLLQYKYVEESGCTSIVATDLMQGTDNSMPATDEAAGSHLFFPLSLVCSTLYDRASKYTCHHERHSLSHLERCVHRHLFFIPDQHQRRHAEHQASQIHMAQQRVHPHQSPCQDGEQGVPMA